MQDGVAIKFLGWVWLMSLWASVGPLMPRIIFELRGVFVTSMWGSLRLMRMVFLMIHVEYR